MPVRKVDLRKQLKYLYSPSASEVQTVEVPKFNFIMVDGKGDPNGPEFAGAIGTLYALSFTLKFTTKKENAIDYPVMALEGLWGDNSARFDASDRKGWNWTAMIMQPEFITRADYKRAVEDVRKKKDLKSLGVARLEAFREGLSAQIMHLGPYSTEARTIETLHNYIKENGGKPRGRHHEIYLGNPRRASPSKLKTILRQPFERMA